MTIWQPELAPDGVPRYRAIADALARDIAAGRLPAGARLPTHRALATEIGVTVGTVSRAYAEAARLGLISGEVGRGTFVREQPFAESPRGLDARDPSPEGQIDLSQNFPSPVAAAEPLAHALRALSERGDLERLVAYQPPAGTPAHRAAGAEWIRRSGLDTDAERVVVTSGVQHGLMLAFSALAQPGDRVLCEALSYPGMSAIARLLRLRLEGLPLDEHGLRPDALEAACESGRARALYCAPTLQNPTAATMPESRRRRIAEIARRHDLAVVEDDVYGFLPPDAPAPLVSLLPDRGYYLTSLSKCGAPGLRVGFLHAPRGSVDRLASCLRTMIWMAPPLMGEIAARWIADGVARRLVEAQREEARVRVALARRSLRALPDDAPDVSCHLWLPLPDPWRAAAFTARARAHGVAVTPSESFVVGRGSAPHAVRLCIGAPAERADLERALVTLAALLDATPEPAGPVI